MQSRSCQDGIILDAESVVIRSGSAMRMSVHVEANVLGLKIEPVLWILTSDDQK